MKNLKQIIAVVLVLTLVAAASIGITVAYLTDRDSKANVFTVGDVSIKLHENFADGATLIPGVDIAKEPYIENTGKNDAWVWATVAIPAALDNADAAHNIVHFNFDKNVVNDAEWTWTDENGNWLVEENVDIKGIEYNVYTVLHQTALKNGETTSAVITNVYLDTHIDIDPDGNMCWIENGVASDPVWNVNENAYPVMYVSAYGIQKETFATVQEAYAAYQKQWGSNGTEYADSVADVSNLTEWNGAVGNIDYINVTEDIDAENFNLPADLEASINLGGNTLSGNYFQVNGGELTLENGTLKTGTSSDYAAIIRGADATATFTDVEVLAGGGGVAAADGAEVTFDGSIVDVTTASTSGRYNFYAVGTGSKIEINGGTFSFSKTLNQKRAYVYAEAGTTVIINGGTFGKASTRSGYTAGILGTGTVIINGGTFGFDPSNWVAATSTCEKVGDVWVVTPNA
ncbi:MAG: hypothetical protein E7436_00960 [Ruminococcaceae bacterium]|nr:hypothetical protein [Oscillospiraceae bacterium]